MHSDWLAILPHILLAAGGTVIFCAGAFLRPRPVSLFVLALGTLAAAAAALVPAEPAAPAIANLIDPGAYARFFTFLFLMITALALFFMHLYSKVRGFAGDELYGLLLFACLGMILVAAAVHWLIFFLGLEMLSLSLYILIAIHRGEAASNEAGLKYFIMGAVASAFLTFGIALLYAETGALEIGPSLAAQQPEEVRGILLALCFILVGIGFKVSLVPFHLWTPDVYQGAPAPVTAFLSTGSKIALFAALIRVCLHLSAPAWAFSAPALWALAAVTMAVGNLTALYQLRVKRLLAYSSIGQMGYLFMTLAALKQGSLPALMFYLAVYAVMDLGAFGILGTLSAPSRDLDALEDCQGLGYSHPWRGAILALCLLSLAGLPPTAGFIGKFILFQAVLQAHFVVLAVIGILSVIIAIFFYLKVVVSLYMRPPSESPAIPGADLPIRLAGAAILLAILWLGLYPGPLLELIARIAGGYPA